jgi:hypothetical protein
MSTIKITTTASADLGYPLTLGALRAFVAGATDFHDDAVVTIRTNENQRDGAYITATITVTP